MELKGIDVSKHQGDIDWKKVKASGIQFAIIRISYGTGNVDIKAIQNIQGCIDNNIPFGVYTYSYALNIAQAEQEANLVLKTLEPYKDKISYPVIIDMEDADGYKAKNGMPSKTMLTDICITECEMFEKAGYYAMIYANLDWFKNKLETDRLDRFDKWLAQWSSAPTFTKPFGIWQYTSSGSVAGINGRVDMNISYKDYPNIIKGMTNEVEQPLDELHSKTIEQLADEVMAGKYGDKEERKANLKDRYNEVQAEVNRRYKENTTPKVGDLVILKENIDYTNKKLATWTKGSTFTLVQLKNDRAVISRDNVVIAAVKISNLTKA